MWKIEVFSINSVNNIKALRRLSGYGRLLNSELTILAAKIVPNKEYL